MIEDYYFLRFADQENVDEQYISNCLDAILFFGKWYINLHNGEIKYSLEEYVSMLQFVHRLVVGNSYYGYTGERSEHLPSSIIRFREDLELPAPTLKTEWYEEELKQYNLEAGQVFIPQVVDMKKSECRVRVLDKDNIQLRLPSNKKSFEYVKMLAGCMHLLGTQEFDYKNFISLLGCYVHLFAIGHPFRKVNFSVCMLQINAILMVHGLKGISHGWLDFKCFMNDTNKIIVELGRMVKDAQNINV